MKHAILVLAHQTALLIAKNIKALDDPQIDFFIHVDQKAELTDFEWLARVPKYSQVSFIPRHPVTWGGFSLIQAEWHLFSEAYQQGTYEYFHLVSESDLTLLDHHDFLTFFKEKQGHYLEAVAIAAGPQMRRAGYYYPLQEVSWLARHRVGWGLNRLLVILQQVLGLRRSGVADFYRGSSWCSLRRSFVAYLTAAETWARICRDFTQGHCLDEVYKQTLLVPWLAAHPQEEWVNDSLRYIDWRQQKASPKWLTATDLPAIQSSGAVFARKVAPDSSLIQEVIPND